MLVLMILARLLTPFDFGLISASLVVVRLAEVFSQMGVGPSITQYKFLKKEHVSAGFKITMSLSVMVGVLVFSLASPIAKWFGMPELVKIVRALSIVFPIMGSGIVSNALIIRSLMYKWMSFIDAISYLVGYCAVGVILAFNGMGVWSLVIAIIVQTTITAFISIWIRPIDIFVKTNKDHYKYIVNYGTGLTLAKIANYGSAQIDNMVTGRYLGAEALGVYGRAYEFLMMPTNMIGTVLDKTLFPIMSKIQDDIVQLHKVYLRSISLVALLMFPISALVILLAHHIVPLFLGNQWGATVLPLQVLISGLLFRTSYKMSDSLARATGAVYRRAWRQWIFAIAILVFSLIGAKIYGVVGVSIGVVLAVIVNFSLMMQLSFSIIPTLKLREVIGIHVKYFAVTIIALLFTYFLSIYIGEQGSSIVQVLLISIIFIIIYLIILLMNNNTKIDLLWGYNLIKKILQKKQTIKQI